MPGVHRLHHRDRALWGVPGADQPAHWPALSILTTSGDIAGFRVNSDIDACDSGFALELWSNVPATACVPGQTAAYGYLLIPFVKGGVLSDFTIGNDAVNFTVSGANSKEGSGWGKRTLRRAADQHGRRHQVRCWIRSSRAIT